jgi:hypothetical protein
MNSTIERISVLITAYKNSHLVERYVSSLKEAFNSKLPETIIIDDTPNDPGIKKVVEAYAAKSALSRFSKLVVSYLP